MASRYLIGIDLGTTNSVVAYIDTQSAASANPPIPVFPIRQVLGSGEVQSFPALPSFLYFPTGEELSNRAVMATWNEQPAMVTGVLAREQGALIPSRQVSSAKSWLSYPGVHRRAKILPAQAEPPQPMISPVEASARYLMHLRDAWNGSFGAEAEARFEHQEIVLTVPGSFAEEARELTIEAARMAGLENVRLLEEPLAAFYAWIATNPHALSPNADDLRDGELILICDIGGGTSDFSLVRTRVLDGQVQFERTAIGEHLLIGGDNVDLALARHVEIKLPGSRLNVRQRYALRRVCCAAKERLLNDTSVSSVAVTILGSGRSVVGQTLSVDLARDEVLQILNAGFLPLITADEMPTASRAVGLRELGLPYATDPAITKHLAAFLKQAALAVNEVSSHPLVRPDVVLFNGGFCAPAVTRDRILDAISAWFGGMETGWRPKILHNESVDSAVARGAAYYARARRNAGLRIRAGCSHSYYIGLPPSAGLQAVCILPVGAEEGTTLPLSNREFVVVANRPVSFTLYSSRTRHDAHGEVVALDEKEVHRHPPLVTLLRYGKKMRDVYVTIRLRATFTEVGTLEIWCESRDTPHRWRLQFELREEETHAGKLDTLRLPLHQPAESCPAPIQDCEAGVVSATQLLSHAFGSTAGRDLSPGTVLPQIEEVLGSKRDSWSAQTARRFADVLINSAEGRKLSPAHEMRWLNLSGFCTRPGFGTPDDPSRVSKLCAMASHLVFSEDLQCRVGALVLFRRISGGISAREQQALYRMCTEAHGAKKKRLNRQLDYEQWRLLASLEHLLSGSRALLGNELLPKIRKDPADPMWIWSLGRLGARIPLYGPLHCIVRPDIAAEWLQVLLGLPAFTTTTASAILLIARLTGDLSRDIHESIRAQAIARLTELGMIENDIQLLSTYVPPERADATRTFGESLPSGLELISAADCLLSVPAFHGSNSTFSRSA